MKKLSLLMLVVVMAVAGTSLGAVYDLKDVLLNPGFDMDPTANGAGTPFTDYNPDYRPLETDAASAGALGWYRMSGENTTGYYLNFDDPAVEYTSPYCLGMDNYSNSPWCGVYQSLMVDLNDGDTVTWTFYLKQWPDVLLPSYVDVHLYSAATGALGDVHILNTEMGTTEWSEHAFSYTHSGATLAAGSLVFGFDMIDVPGTYHAILIDAVPEPATMSLLGIGGLFAICRKRRA